ncbi:MAG: hypothetical protein ABSA33_04565, partial [Candidatus Micrarchaeaceae archaeon]
MSDEENQGRDYWLDWRLAEIERGLAIGHPRGVRRSFLDLYFSPRVILIAFTLLNVALFIGGTVYTGVQVRSIQERYEEAFQKISDAKLKYETADMKLKSIQEISDQAQRTIRDI